MGDYANIIVVFAVLSFTLFIATQSSCSQSEIEDLTRANLKASSGTKSLLLANSYLLIAQMRMTLANGVLQLSTEKMLLWMETHDPTILSDVDNMLEKTANMLAGVGDTLVSVPSALETARVQFQEAGTILESAENWGDVFIKSTRPVFLSLAAVLMGCVSIILTPKKLRNLLLLTGVGLLVSAWIIFFTDGLYSVIF